NEIAVVDYECASRMDILCASPQELVHLAEIDVGERIPEKSHGVKSTRYAGAANVPPHELLPRSPCLRRFPRLADHVRVGIYPKVRSVRRLQHDPENAAAAGEVEHPSTEVAAVFPIKRG